MLPGQVGIWQEALGDLQGVRYPERPVPASNHRDGTSYSAGGSWLLVSPEVEFDQTATVL